MRKPILLGVDGQAREIIEEFDAGQFPWGWETTSIYNNWNDLQLRSLLPASGYSFTDFLTHSMPIVVVADILFNMML